MIKKSIIPFIILTSILAGCAGRQKSGKPVIFVSILPQKYLVERIAGDKAEVQSMTLPGQDPHTFEPSPGQMFALSDAVLYFTAGIEFEKIWMSRIAEANPSMTVVDSISNITLIPFAPEDEIFGHHEEEHDHGALDPHVWLDPDNAVTMSLNIFNALIRYDVTNFGYYKENYQKLIKDLVGLDIYILKLLKDTAVTNMLVFHPSWGYFAKAYGLTQIAIEYEGKEPSPKQVGLIIDYAKAHKIDTLFVQPQFNEASARMIAGEVGCKIVTADPLAENYIENLKSLAAALAQP
ncbi:MAG: zinc ABC transporter solute-binding protein [Brevinematales bacterium]|nr:zinc ABC transporter solute-binding protein [Brevinematales bacterium]